MSASPVIFLSAVTGELGPARALCARVLTGLGYQPDWQDVFPADGGDLLGILAQKIERADAVLALIGRRYGAESPAPHAEFGRVSYTQFEVLHARSRGKKCILIFCDGYPTPEGLAPESDEFSALQAAYVAKLRAGRELFQQADAPRELENLLLRLRDDLDKIRAEFFEWRNSMLKSSDTTTRELSETKKELGELKNVVAQLLGAVRQYPQVDAEVKTARPDLQNTDAEGEIYRRLAQQLGVDETVLRVGLPKFAAALKADPDASLLDRANAAYTAKDFSEAERLALAAMHEAEAAQPPRIAEAIEARQRAGWSAHERFEYARALTHFRAAEKQTDRVRNPAAWARVQYGIVTVLRFLGRFAETERTLRAVVDEFVRSLGAEHPETLKSRMDMTRVLFIQGQRAEAERQVRELVATYQRVLGPEHPETLKCRGHLVRTIQHQAKYAEAEVEYRGLIAVEERVLGPEHSETLTDREFLGFVVGQQGRPAELEAEFRAVLAIRERTLGPEHPDTLVSRNLWAGVLVEQARYIEAEAEVRALVGIAERIFGPEFPDTLIYRGNRAVALAMQGNFAEAETEHRAALASEHRVFGPEHAMTLDSRRNLSYAINGQGRHAGRSSRLRIAALDRNIPEPSKLGTSWRRR